MSRTIAEELQALPLSELKSRFEARAPTAAERAALESDRRAGARALPGKLEAAKEREKQLDRELRKRQAYERELWDEGLTLVAGCDEAGVSPLAGPIVAAAVILSPHDVITGVDDSKKLSPETRERLFDEVKSRAVTWGIGEAQPDEVDRLNPYHAGILAMSRALHALDPRPEHVLLDARRVPDFSVPQTPIIKGDALSHTIGAASILAKVHRDRLMVRYDAQFPGYGLAEHKGYPVAAHVAALMKLGPCAIHRRSYRPVREAMGIEPVQDDLFGKR